MQKQPHSAGGKSVGLVLYTTARTNTWVTVSPKVNLRGGYDVVSQALGGSCRCGRWSDNASAADYDTIYLCHRAWRVIKVLEVASLR